MLLTRLWKSFLHYSFFSKLRMYLRNMLKMQCQVSSNLFLRRISHKITLWCLVCLEKISGINTVIIFSVTKNNLFVTEQYFQTSIFSETLWNSSRWRDLDTLLHTDDVDFDNRKHFGWIYQQAFVVALFKKTSFAALSNLEHNITYINGICWRIYRIMGSDDLCKTDLRVYPWNYIRYSTV